MSETIMIDVVHIGPQKSATTWVYKALREHPEVTCALSDRVHYFDMHYHKGAEWYAQQFPATISGQKKFEATPSYIRSPWVPRRIAAENPNAKIVLTLRDPIERAFSHYWHEKKKQRFTFDFSEVLTNYDLYSAWLEPGFYAEHIERFLQHFPKERILAQQFETLSNDPETFLHELFSFLEVDTTFTPSVLHKKVNPAGDVLTIPRRLRRKIGTVADQWMPEWWHDTRAASLFSGKTEYLQGIPEELERELRTIALPEIERTERLLNISLSHWKHYDDVAS